nr:uncharacterized protein LOC111838373 isoform X2 [Paramormyrops kingsleyae]
MTTCHAYSYFSNEEDLRQVEDAVKEAITAVITVFCKLNNNRMREYEMKVAERDKENSALKMQLERAEDELMALRQLRMSREYDIDDTDSDSDIDSDPQAACYSRFGSPAEGEGRQRARGRSKRARGAGDPPCERPLKREFADPCERALARRDTRTEDAATHSPNLSVTEDVEQQELRNDVCEEQERSPRLFTGPEHLRIKEEPVDFDTVFIKWEVSEEHVRREEEALGKEHEAHAGPTACVPLASPCVVGVQEVTFAQSAVSGEMTSVAQQRRLSNRERQQRYREKIRADPERQRAYREKDRCRWKIHTANLRSYPSVTISVNRLPQTHLEITEPYASTAAQRSVVPSKPLPISKDIYRRNILNFWKTLKAVPLQATSTRAFWILHLLKLQGQALDGIQ